MRKYAVNEIFYSLQGEGRNAGRAAVFIRFAGCNLACPFCDTDFQRNCMMSAQEIIDEAAARAKTSLCVLTGGEPTMQADFDLIARLHTCFRTIAIETNGTRPIPPGVDWVTVSPKSDYFPAPVPIVAHNINEVKVVFDGAHDPRHWLAELIADYYYLQPCDTGDKEKNVEIMKQCAEYILKNPRWRLSLQTHKIVGIR